jgi:hypothetical protein
MASDLAAALSNRQLHRAELMLAEILGKAAPAWSWGVPCGCAECMAKAGPDSGAEDPEFLLDSDDAEIASTVTQSYATEIGRAKFGEAHGLPPTPEELAAAFERVQYQRDLGLSMLSDSAKERLVGLFGEAGNPNTGALNDALSRMVEGHYNPIAAAHQMSAEFHRLEQGGEAADKLQYTPYEFARLARTEAAFADDAAAAAEIADNYPDANSDAFDAAGAEPPIHPFCFCMRDVVLGGDGKYYVTLVPTGAACSECLDLVDQIEAAIP